MYRQHHSPRLPSPSRIASENYMVKATKAKQSFVIKIHLIGRLRGCWPAISVKNKSTRLTHMESSSSLRSSSDNIQIFYASGTYLAQGTSSTSFISNICMAAASMRHLMTNTKKSSQALKLSNGFLTTFVRFIMFHSVPCSADDLAK